MNKISSVFVSFWKKLSDISFINKIATKTSGYFRTSPFKAHLNLSLILSFVLLIIIQCFQCMSVFKGVSFIFGNTYFFIINYLIILLSFTLCFFSRKRLILIYLFAILWFVLGLANFIVMVHRPMPIAAVDFIIMTTTMDIIPHYFSIFHIILIGLAVIAGIALFVYLFLKSKKYERTFKNAVIPVISAASLLIIFLAGGNFTGNLKISYNDVNAAYDKHGFVYCFASSFFAKGIPKPNDYSMNDIQLTAEKYKSEPSKVTSTPNILVVQLESFMDPDKYSKYKLTQDPLPNFHRICKENGEGALIVPSNGGGTVNTEFEILTGMNLEYFGTIEYPYTTILKETTCEAAPFILDNYGYTSHAIHNHTGVFYARHLVYPNLGFDAFTPIEFMQHEKTDTGWAKDEAIYQSIKESVESTEGTDFVFAVTVQGHGAYYNYDIPENPFKVEGKNELTGSEFKKACMYEHYSSLLNETDKVIGDIYDYVMNSDEDFIVILYGDHLPSLDIAPEEYSYGSSYMTTYTVFSNIKEGFDYKCSDIIPTYRLMSSVYTELGIDTGLINKINRNYDNPSYEDDLRTIQYDMLYGKKYSYGERPYIKKNTKFGCNEIVISSVVYEDGFLTVRGDNFNQKSEININGRERETAFIDKNTIVCACSKVSEDDIISVCQTAVEGTKLNEIIFTK